MVRDLPGELPLDRSFSTVTDASSPITASRSGYNLALGAISEGSATVVLASPDKTKQYASIDVSAANVDHLTIASIGPDSARAALQAVNDSATAWLANDQATYRLPAGSALQYDGLFDFSNVANGSYTVEVDSGGMTYSAPFVVAH